MLFNFSRPVILFLIPVLLLFSWLSLRKAKLLRFRKNLILILRFTLIILVVFSLAGTGTKKTSGSSTTIFAVDGSASMEKAEGEVSGFIKDAISTMKKSDRAGIIRFGLNSMIEVLPSENPIFAMLQSRVSKNHTNIENGLKFAGSLIPASDRKRVVLISDGKQNSGDAITQARLMRSQGFIVDVYPISNIIQRDVQVKDVNVPKSVHINQTFEINVSIYSTHKTSAVIRVYTDRQITLEKEIELSEGINKFAFVDSSKEGGMVTYTVTVDSGGDEIVQNNKMSAYTYVEDLPHILLIHDENNDGAELVKILEDDINIDVNRPEAAPSTLSELQKYDAFILSNVSIEKLKDPFLDSLEKVIRLQGKGLLVTGGDNSYGPGGYYKTILEEVLPVNMDIKPKEEDPNLGLVLVIDKSGSMATGQYGVSRIDLAKEAAIRSASLLKDEDMIGVIGFDGAVKWVVEMQDASNKKDIEDAIGTIRAGGGTQILPALKEAYLALLDADTKLKHIILLTDGQAERTGYSGLVDDIVDAGISISTVAVGSGADTELLAAIAWGGNGRYYMTDEFTDIPKIFAKETFMAGKTYFNNRIFTPRLINYSEILAGIEAIPSLEGYVASTAKQTSTVIFESDTEDPILSVWQYGLGRTAAWTSDAKGMWTSSWMQWELSPRFWKNLSSWLLQDRYNQDYAIGVSFTEGKGYIELRLPEDDPFKGDIIAELAGPEDERFVVEFLPVEPGLYRGEFYPEDSGVYVASISFLEEGEEKRQVSAGITIPYPPEYDTSGNVDTNILERIADAGGGRILESAQDVFAGELEQVVATNDITHVLVFIAILVFLLEIAVRRLNINFDKYFKSAGALAKNSIQYSRQVLNTYSGKIKIKGTEEITHEKEMDRKADEKQTKDQKSINENKDDAGQSEESHVTALLEKMRKRNNK